MVVRKLQESIFELLQVSVGTRDTLLCAITLSEWEALLEEGKKQSIDGVLLYGVERLPEEQRPPKLFLLQWIGHVQIVEKNTNRLTLASSHAVKFFRNNGFVCSLLKGAAVGRYYPRPERRQSGDVDIWHDGGREKIYDFARSFDKNGMLFGVNYHYIHFQLIDDVHIEVHIWPSYLSSPIRNRRLLKFCNLHRPTMETALPSLSFDRVFIMLHCYRHMCGHGLGLRQIMDYFYVLQQGFIAEEKADSVYWIRQLGLSRFAEGIMWVLRQIFGLGKDYLLMTPNEKEGRFIIKEVMQTGNMGHGDTRNWGSKKSPVSRFFLICVAIFIWQGIIRMRLFGNHSFLYGYMPGACEKVF